MDNDEMYARLKSLRDESSHFTILQLDPQGGILLLLISILEDKLDRILAALSGKIMPAMEDIEKQCFACSEVEGIEFGEQRSWVAMARMIQAATRMIRSLVADAEGKKEGKR
jgi:hypothetical protein